MKIFKNKELLIVLTINIFIFSITNILFNIKYEEVDDFIIYNLYSGLDGTYNIHGIYIHPILCFILGLFFRLIPTINWHSIYLLISQFVCFTIIGYIIIKKHNNGISIFLYAILGSVFYPILLMLIQFTSVAALLIITSFFLLIYMLEQKNKVTVKYKVLILLMFFLGVITRIESVLIALPLLVIYFIVQLIRKNDKNILKMVKYFSAYIIIVIITYTLSLIMYNLSNTYKEYMKYNNARGTLQDFIYVDYGKNKEIFDEINWSRNDHYMFYTCNFGDEKIFSKENIERILEYKIQKDGKFNFDISINKIIDELIKDITNEYTYISLVFMLIFLMSLLINKTKNKFNILVFVTTFAIHILLLIVGRSLKRVIIPEYFFGTALLIYNLRFEYTKITCNRFIKYISLLGIIILLCYINGYKYKLGYNLSEYASTRELVEYTNQNKQNIYLCTVPSLQYRYLAYSVYQMPPKGSFSNLRVMGGWDMYTKNYYDFKNRYNLNGDLLDLLKENVYLIDGKVTWIGVIFDNYKDIVKTAIKENYNIDVDYDKIEEFDNLKIYKVHEVFN